MNDPNLKANRDRRLQSVLHAHQAGVLPRLLHDLLALDPPSFGDVGLALVDHGVRADTALVNALLAELER